MNLRNIFRALFAHHTRLLHPVARHSPSSLPFSSKSHSPLFFQQNITTMAGLLASSPHPYTLSFLNRTSLSLHLSYRRNPRFPRLPPPSAGKSRRIRIDRSSGGRGDDDEEPSPRPRLSAFTDEWGEISDPEPEPPAEPDPPKNDDEWGEQTEEEAAKLDPAVDEDEWGNGTQPAAAAAVDDKIGELKSCLVDTFYGTELGFRAGAEVRGEIFELVSQLEARNPTPKPNEAPELLDGKWILLYTAFSELLPLLAVGATPALKIKNISQSIDSKNRTIINATTLASPFATLSFSASASFEVQSPSRIQVQFKEGSFQPPEVSSNLNLPEKIELFGQKIDLQTIQQLLNPIQQAVANISRGISGQPPLKVPIPGNRAKSWLLTTYLDHDFRISRGDGGLFVLAKEGSPLLDQLS